MNKIKEMAEKYVEERRDLDVGHANAQFDCFNMINAVELGANYVLETIEKECKRIKQICKNHIENPVDEEDKVVSWASLDGMEYMLNFIEQLKK